MLVQRLNMDNSWLFQLDNSKILVDPWLEGVEVDFFSWFNTQWHRTAPLPYDQLPSFDAVLITQKYPDHFHEITLKKLNPKIVLAPAYLEAKIQACLPNVELLLFHTRQTSIKFQDIEIQWYPTNRKMDPIYDAYMLKGSNQRIFFAPHGYFFKESVTLDHVDLLVTSFNEFRLPFFLGGLISPGLAGVKHLDEVIDPRFILATHDEDKHAKGLVIKWAKVKWNQASSFKKIKELEPKILELTHYNPLQL